MGLPVTVYSSNDVGAPQLSSTTKPLPSEIINILKKCLVEGYGSKAPLGWSVAFEDSGTFKIAFRNSTVDGSGGYVQYWSDNGLDATNSNLSLKSAMGMSALDNFNKAGYRFRHWNSTTNKKWTLIGTSTGFYFIQRFTTHDLNFLNSSQYEIVYFVGDLDSNYINDSCKFTIAAPNFGGDMTNINYGHSLAILGTTSCNKIYGVDGNEKENPHSVDTGTYTSSVTGSNYTLETQGITPILAPVIIRTTSPSSTDIDNISCSISGKNPWFRGVIPGLVSIGFCGYGDHTWPTIKNWNGHDYMLLRGYYNGVWLNISEWYS
ncbi:hypothetical protein [Shewanella holmiensis]|uniref:Uncharacterized protein n=1 Tax=Shewanella holmiensis TaxID=2952222 RepID=A0A9X3AWI2_9GAMM|nr:hypothetical protein [Shewanella holmiensis]MCT7942378.1 hypothetical protein [Shewanella holmiensis]